MATKTEATEKYRVEWSDSRQEGMIPLNANGAPRRMFVSGETYELNETEVEVLKSARSLVPTSTIVDSSKNKNVSPDNISDSFSYSSRGRINVIPLDKADKRVTNENERLRTSGANKDAEIARLKAKLKEAGVNEDEVPDKRSDSNKSTV